MVKKLDNQQIIKNLEKNGWKPWTAPDGRKFWFKTVDGQKFMVWEYNGQLYYKLKKSYIITTGARFTNAWEQIGYDAGLLDPDENYTRRERAEAIQKHFRVIE